MDWQEAVAKAIGATKCSPTERRRAFQELHDTGIGYRLPGHISDTLKAMVASGAVTTNEEVAHEQRHEG
jgi:hypothetical protein